MIKLSDTLTILAAEIHKSEAEVIAMAVNAGIKQLWRERTLGLYLKGALSRETAVERVGIDLVKLAERQHKAMLEDIKWAME